MDVIPEPVSKWSNLNGTDLLQLIYDNPKRWAMTQVKKDFIAYDKFESEILA